MIVTHTTPSRANAVPSYPPIEPDPFMNAPPCTHTSTGRPDASGSGVHTLRLRHSSPGITTSGTNGRNRGGWSPFGEVGPYSVAARTPDQGSTGRGGRIRFAPNGAAA